MQGYVQRFYTFKEGGVFYTSVYLGHNKTFEVIQTGSAQYMEEMRAGVYRKALQCEESICIGWLLYTVPSIDLAILSEDLKQRTGMEVALQFWKCSLQLPKGSNIPEKKHPKAIHIEISRGDYLRKKADLIRQYYDKDVMTWPLGIKVCLIPELKECVGVH